MALVSWYIAKTEYMKVSGLRIKEKVKAMNDIPMAINMKEIFIEVKLMEKESITGRTEKNMMVNGLMESKMATVCGEESLVTLTLANGRILRQMDMAFINGRMVTDTKVPGSTA